MIYIIKLAVVILVFGIGLFTCRSPVCLPDDPLIIQFVDSNGRNLLDYATPNHYYMKNIKVFTFTNKVKVLYTDSAICSQGRTLFLSNPANSVFISFVEKTMLLELSPGITDTVTCLQSGGCPLKIDKAWYNGTLVFDRISKFQSPVVIVK